MKGGWYFAHDEEGTYCGPHDTREDAIKAARSDEPDIPCWVGQAGEFKPSTYFPDVDRLMDDMEDLIYDDANWWDDRVFEFRDGKTGEELETKLNALIDEYLEATCFPINDPEKVEADEPL